MAARRFPQRPEFVLERSRTILLGVGVLFASIALFVFRIFPAGGGTAASLQWLAAAAIIGVGALFTREHRISNLFAIGFALCSIRSVYPVDAPVNPGAVIGATSALMLWAGFVLPTLGGLLVAGFALAAPWLFGAELTFGMQTIALGRVAFSTLVLSAIIPLALAALIRAQQTQYVGALEQRNATLSKHESELSDRVERQAAELEISQQKFAQAQKLETVGTMASGLAHELNNLLTPIRGMAELVATGAEREDSRRHGKRILAAAESAASITGALLTYARKGSFSPVRTRLKQLLEGQILPVLSQLVPSSIQIETELEQRVSADVDRVLLQQCITNLVFNAVDAMPRGGTLTIRLYEDLDGGSLTESGADLGAAILEVEDTGEGMESETVEHVFDPFFTTKPVGSGTGLGLAMVHGCVIRHGGEIEVRSAPKEGSTFTLRFPISRAPVPSRPWPVLGEEKDRPVVVIASVDEDTRDELEEMLSDLSCTPIATGELSVVRNLLAEVGERVDLLIVDHRSELESHRRFVRDARALLPDLPVAVLTSGTRDPALDRLVGTAAVRFARAPVDPTVLGALLSDLLRPAGYELPYWALPGAGSRTGMSAAEIDLPTGGGLGIS